MAFEIADYDDLIERIIRRAGGSSDSEFTDGVQEAIHLAEAEMNTSLRVSEMMVRSIETVDEKWESLPPGFLALRAAWRVEDPDDEDLDVPLIRRTSQDNIAYISKRVRGDPKWIFLSGGQYRIEPREDNTTYRVRLLFYKRVPDLSEDNPCTVLLNRYPYLYLNGALANLEAWLHGDPRLPVWRAMFERGIAAANAMHAKRIGGGA